MAKVNSRAARLIRHARVRSKVRGDSERPRLAVFRSLNHIYVQVIDDSCGHTLAAASTLDITIKDNLENKNKSSHAEMVGELIAQKAREKGITQVVFDRGGYKYHGRVKSLAEAARKAGLKF
ncbi:MAG: 50S ribosomal protein L18 [Dehalococcoidales bacterium]|jgi:large subunit ribosomal protein L18|nr:50S ribosomal protein L18 [Dehalococcoidales bacterium]MDD5604670.1 50S ribosomal protein L18 [Dehalococcoidales bacterium]MDX9986124.1 50S ribosomal protein L18 [Dehalococcoidales bacterium]NLE89903.1 50S ribosomal protein L18 [Dehalococcoidales bacterium]